ncbi:Cellulosome-anchoring protein precursor [compost metagenome]
MSKEYYKKIFLVWKVLLVFLVVTMSYPQSIYAAGSIPIVTASEGSAEFVQADNTSPTPVKIDPAIQVSDPDSATLSSATVAITGNAHLNEDVLSFINDGSTMGNIIASYNSATGVMTLTSSGAAATVAQWQAALRAVTYTNTAMKPPPNTATRTLSITVSDGVSVSEVATRTLNVTATNQSPVLTTSGGSVTFSSGPVIIDSGLTISDLDSDHLSSARITIFANFYSSEDRLTFTENESNFGDIKGSYNSATGVLTLISMSQTATVAQWQAALRSITYDNTAITPSTPSRVVSFTVNDGMKVSNTGTKMILVTQGNRSPVLTVSSGTSRFVAGDNKASTPVSIDPDITVTDLDNTTLSAGTVAITGNFKAGEDVLAFYNNPATMGNISSFYDADTGVLSLYSGDSTASVTEWQAALRSVTYTNTVVTPNTVDRTITFIVHDGNSNSNTATRTVNVKATNQTPKVTTSGGTRSGESFPVIVDPGVKVTDLDTTTLASAKVAISGNFHGSEDSLSFVNKPAEMGNIAANYDAANGVLTLTSQGAAATLAQWQSALRSVTYANNSLTPTTASRTIRFSVNDGQSDSAGAERMVSVAAPTVVKLSASPDTISIQAGQSAKTVITATYSNQVQVSVTPQVTWTVKSPAIASVVNGLISGTAAGSTILQANFGGQSVNINLTITAAANPNTGGGSGYTPPTQTTPVPSQPPQVPQVPTAPVSHAFSEVVDVNRILDYIKKALNSGAQPSFKDASSHWGSGEISLAVRLGIAEGYEDNMFRPDAAITRAEFSALIVRAFNLTPGHADISFTDTTGNWAADYIHTLASNGIIHGYGDGDFMPSRNITRAEMLRMIAGLLNLKELKASGPGEFTDISEHWAQSLIEDAAKAGIIQGMNNHRFAPDKTATRAESLVLILRSLKAQPEVNSLLASIK